MLIQCPNCRTTYKVSDDTLAVSNPTFRCSRCKHIFSLGTKPTPKPAEETTVAAAPPAREHEERELSFSFPPREEKTPAKEADEAEPEPGLSYDQSSPAGEEEQPALHFRGKEDHWSLTRGPGENEESFSPAEERPEFKHERRETPPGEEAPIASALETEIDRPASIRPYFILCVSLVIIYSFLALVHQVEPRALDPFLERIPWVGPSILKNDHLRGGIVLQSLRTRVQSIQGNREVLVLSGVALNQTAVKIREVRIEGDIFGANGKQIERQVITVGNAISANIIRDLTAQEIATLQKLSPPKRFEIAPEESAAFVIVFLKPAAEIKSFGCRVLSADQV